MRCLISDCPRTHGGRWGWLGLAGYVVAWDLISHDSLSAAFSRGNRKFTAAVTAVITLHLYGYLPRRCDPFYIFIDRIK